MHFEHFSNIICYKRETNNAWQSGICVSRVDGRHNRTHRPSVDSTLLPAVIDQIFAKNRDFHGPLALDAAVNFNSFLVG